MKPRHPATWLLSPQGCELMRSRVIGATVGALLMLGGASRVSTAVCGFPWTVTATSVAGGNAAIFVCGTYAGCLPHNQQAAVVGNEIRVTYTQAELPGCQCVQPNGEFRTPC